MNANATTPFLDVLLLTLAMTWSLVTDEVVQDTPAEPSKESTSTEAHEQDEVVKRPELVVKETGGKLFVDGETGTPVTSDEAIRRAKRENKTLVICPAQSVALDVAAECKRDGTLPFKLKF